MRSGRDGQVLAAWTGISPTSWVSTARSILHAAAVVRVSAAVTTLQEGTLPSWLQSDTTRLGTETLLKARAIQQLLGQ